MWQECNEKIAYGIMKLLETEQQDGKNTVAKVRYALLVLLDEGEKFILLSLFFGIFYDVKKFILAFLVVFSLRIFMGGSHRRTMVGCFLSSLVNFGLILWLAASFAVPVSVTGGLVVLLVWEIILWTPLASPQQLRYTPQQKRRIKKKAFGVLGLWGCIFPFLSGEMGNVVFWALAFQGLEVLVVVLWRSKILQQNVWKRRRQDEAVMEGKGK